jgi:hypothetical protein
MALAFASSSMGAAVNQERASDGILIATNPGKSTFYIVLYTPTGPSRRVCFSNSPREDN